MTIFTQGNNIKTHYHDLVVSRAVGNKTVKIDMSKQLPKQYPTEALTLLNELANLDNEDFKALSEFQRR